MNAPNPSPVDRLRSAQPAVIELFTLLSPYAAAALPAALSGGNVASHIMPSDSGAWGGIVGLFSGAALEMIGIVVGWVIVNIISRTRNVPLNKNWKLWAAIYAGLHYVTANLAANVWVVAFGNNPTTLAIATGALSTMSVPAVIVSVLRALEIEERNIGAAADDSKKAAAKEANALAFEQGMARMKMQNEHELAQLQARNAAELALAQERTKQLELERMAPVQLTTVGSQAASIDNELTAQVQSMTAQGMSKTEIALALIEQHGISKAQAARLAGVNASVLSRKNEVKEKA